MSEQRKPEPFSTVPRLQLPNVNRRTLIVGGGLAAAGIVLASQIRELTRGRASVFVAKNQKYDGPLVQTMRDGLIACGLVPDQIKGKRILLKPNLVEPSRDAPHMTTHPAIILAAAEVFRTWGGDVIVGEGPGHVRDTEMALVESGVADALDSMHLPFSDLNYEEVVWTPNRGRASKLPGFFFPRSVAEADLVVSLPKMKTHHWVGVTAAMKNLYGVIPGIKYGWPKNVLHHNGIPETVFDINASLPQTIAIVDGIDCMEGDGPIMGTKKPMGLLVMGTSPTAVDATICRLMDVNPQQVPYLALAANRLGPLDKRLIDQRGEAWEPLQSTFQMLDKPHLRALVRHRGVLVS
ncbi:hypothetical protein ETAA8_61200 [Anatilimnocola aggregata]|uniref:DUF362 domain-containing protein n=1 Tax=Anatilimnocola aggregata TaxID=2528021 RepID=A0A517YL57_9BACT|nr:DUF362 domain-containing protein [Anatilimnocola aggregata]QDU30967.1 hypothetical protein ETAA8_61200 [Anatilimnocola aggregata]